MIICDPNGGYWIISVRTKASSIQLAQEFPHLSMDPGLARQTSPEPEKTDPARINLFGNAQEPAPDEDEGDSCSTSTTTDTSDSDDFFQIDPLELGHPSPVEPVRSPQVPAQPHFNTFDNEREISLPAKFSSRSPNEDQNQIQPSELRPPLSPALPNMVRNDVPDPNRIPSWIFTRTKSTSPMEWSVASNESLFSIHMGNSSFSRDPVFFMGRSGELNSFTGMDSYPTPPILPISSLPPAFQPVSPLPPPTPTVPSSPPARLLLMEKPGTAEGSNAAAKTDVLRSEKEEHDSDKESKEHDSNKESKKSDPDKEKAGRDVVHFSESMSCLSEGSAASFQSFAFPILTGDGGRSGSIKVEPEHQQMQQPQLVGQQTPKVAGNPAPAPASPPAEAKGWLSCFFLCCPSCHQ